jgi:cephalosporin-C deacetylase
MPYFDLPLDQLRGHTAVTREPADLDAFWSATLAEAAEVEIGAQFDQTVTPLTVLITFDVVYAGFGGHPIHAWLHIPAGSTTPLPCVVEYIGYGGGRGLPHQHTFWASAGFAHFVMDTRGQGSTWSVGDTADPNAGEASHPGFLTRGILDPQTYYYRRLYVDAVRAVDAARLHPLVDAARVAVVGGSQGGALALAAAGLRGDVVACAPDVPFLADIRRATELIESEPYGELVRYLKVHRDRLDDVFRTLGYFDVAHLARRATAPALFSVGLMDDICPPSGVYAAYNAYAGPKQIVEYAYNEHEGGGEFHQVTKAGWLREHMGGEGER